MTDNPTIRIPLKPPMTEASYFDYIIGSTDTGGLFLDPSKSTSWHLVAGQHETRFSSHSELKYNLLTEIESLKQRVAQLEGSIEIIDELEWDEAIEKARAFFAEREGPVYPDELAESLGTSVSQAIELCEALMEEGLVA